MKINFTKKQMHHLLTIAEAGNWMINSHRNSDELLEEYEEIYDYILATAYKMNIDGVIYDKVMDKHYLTNQAEEERHWLIDAYDQNTFWSDLPRYLAMRDYAREQKARNDNDESRLKRLFELEEKYEYEFIAHGLENLEIKANK